MGIVSMLPEEWRTRVIVLRGGGTDRRGNPLPTEEVHLDEPCLVGPRSTGDQPGFTDVVTTEMAIYRDPNPDFHFRTSDRIRIPEGQRMAGEWSIEGRELETPLGNYVEIRSD